MQIVGTKMFPPKFATSSKKSLAFCDNSGKANKYQIKA